MEFKCRLATHYCMFSEFTINGIEAYEQDFVEKSDRAPELHDSFTWCGNMVASVKKPVPEVLKKYGISRKEYYEIAKVVSRKLSFGSCGLCW